MLDKCCGKCTALQFFYNFNVFKVFILCLIDTIYVHFVRTGFDRFVCYSCTACLSCTGCLVPLDVILILNLTFVTIPFTFELKFDPISCYILPFFASYFLKEKKQNKKKMCSVCHRLVGSPPYSYMYVPWYLMLHCCSSCNMYMNIFSLLGK